MVRKKPRQLDFEHHEICALIRRCEDAGLSRSFIGRFGFRDPRWATDVLQGRKPRDPRKAAARLAQVLDYARLADMGRAYEHGQTDAPF